VSEHFIEASRRKLKALMERRLEKLQFCALLIDLIWFLHSDSLLFSAKIPSVRVATFYDLPGIPLLLRPSSY
jgi:hypothetical protein